MLPLAQAAGRSPAFFTRSFHGREGDSMVGPRTAIASSENPVGLFDMHIAHVGINAETEEEAERVVGQFQTLMGLSRNVVAPISLFAGSLVEVMRPGSGRGTKGHIGFHVNDIDAAERWFAARGFEVNEDARALNPDGSTYLVYFRDEIAGFAIHLTIAE